MTIRQQTRRSLNNDRFEQLSGDTLNLSGNTNIIGTLTIPQNAGLGKVLTSDLSGNTRWGDPILGDSIRKTINQNLHGFSILNVVGFSGSTYNKPIANGTYGGEIIGLVNRVVDVNNFEVTFAGHITSLTGLTQNTTYFLSPTIAGELTDIEPITDGHLSKAMFIADTTTSGWVLPYPGHIVTSGETVLNLGIIPTGINNTITNSGGGTDAILSGATVALAGLMTTGTQSFSGSKSFIIPSGHTDGFNIVETNIPQRVFTINTLNRFLSIDSNNIGYNVGIGTSLPSTKLNVIGNVHLTGGLGVGILNPIAGTIQTSGNVNVGGSVITTFRNGYFIGSKLMVSDFSWGGDNDNVWLGGAINNTVTGVTALEGNANIAIGVNTLSVLTSGNSNIAIGVNALRFNTASSNIAIGRNALFSNTTGNPNIAIGCNALLTNSGGFQNIAVGYNALRLNTAGFRNNAFGHNALGNNTTGEANNAFGYMALFNNITGIRNSAFGEGALGSNSTGSQNSVFGSGSMVANTSGQSNVAVGMNTLVNNTIGNANIAIGNSAGGGIVNGRSNVIIGSDISGLASGLTNNIILGSGSIIRMQFDGTNWMFQGNMGLGITPTARLDIDGQIRIRGGNPAAGHVLTSDVNGLATWQAPTGGGSGNVIGSGTTNTIIKFTGTNAIGDSTISDVDGNVIINGSLQITDDTSIGNVLNILNPARTFNYSITGGAITANRVLNIPAIAGNDTFMTLNTNQIVLGNKTFNPGMFSLNNPSSTFQYSIQTSAIVTNRNVILPLLNADDTFVFENHSQILTNKTLNISQNTFVDTSQAVGDLLRNNGTRVVSFPRGTAGQVLRTNLAGTDIEWATAGGMSGSGSNHRIPKFINANTLGDSGITDDGASITYMSAPYPIGSTNAHLQLTTGVHLSNLISMSFVTPNWNAYIRAQNGTFRFTNSQDNTIDISARDGRFNDLFVGVPGISGGDIYIRGNNHYVRFISAVQQFATVLIIPTLITPTDTLMTLNMNQTIQGLNIFNQIVEFNQQIRIRGGSPAAGHVLTSDVNGLATWQAPTGGGGTFPSAGIALSTGTAWGTSIVNNSANWNTAFGWGNHAGLYLPLGGGTLTGNLTVGGFGRFNELRINNPALTFQNIIVSSAIVANRTLTLPLLVENDTFVFASHIQMLSNKTIVDNLLLNTQASATNHALAAGRNVLTGAGLTGGGNLIADRTLSLTGQALAIHNLATNGIIARTAANTFASRTITGTANQIIVTDGNGIAGNPVLSLPQNIHTTATPTFAGGVFNGIVEMRSNISTAYSLSYGHHEPTWGVNATRPYIVKSFGTGIGDFMYLGSTGNNTNTTQSAMVLGGTGIRFGRGQDNPSGELTTEWMRITNTGNVGIGINPTTRLDINGQIRIRGGSPAAGHVLTSDVNGLATWQAPTGGGGLSFIESPAANLTGTGISVVMTAGESIAIGQLVYFRWDGRVWRSDADLLGAYPVIGIALSSGILGNPITILTHGIIRNDAWAWSVGGVLYMSTVTGEMSQTPPTGTGTRVQVIGVATHADRIFISPSLNLIELS